MYKAIKANRVVDIPESKAESYLAEGYSIFDKAGNLVLAPKTIVAEKLAKEVEALKEKNAALTAENEALRTELAALKAMRHRPSRPRLSVRCAARNTNPKRR